MNRAEKRHKYTANEVMIRESQFDKCPVCKKILDIIRKNKAIVNIAVKD